MSDDNKDKKHEGQIIEIDCKPGSPRPGDLIDDVIKDTGLPKRERVFSFFGNWTWDYNDVDEVVWKKAQPIIKERLTKLHNAGLIRYGSWGVQ